ncbi:hypothetical protein JZ751_007445 [Albula glossodonta]|uniref:Uncharacterized protein n=1 Tax=Albula glossodonta TaxID=121402 RepID=A0A8T2NAA9_9TELE|nr:hypothetical protein JZ751_007445 [Albula glossodonta]
MDLSMSLRLILSLWELGPLPALSLCPFVPWDDDPDHSALPEQHPLNSSRVHSRPFLERTWLVAKDTIWVRETGILTGREWEYLARISETDGRSGGRATFMAASSFITSSTSSRSSSSSSSSSASPSASCGSAFLSLSGRKGSMVMDSVPLMSQRQYGHVCPSDFWVDEVAHLPAGEAGLTEQVSTGLDPRVLVPLCTDLTELERASHLTVQLILLLGTDRRQGALPGMASRGNKSQTKPHPPALPEALDECLVQRGVLGDGLDDGAVSCHMTDGPLPHEVPDVDPEVEALISPGDVPPAAPPVRLPHLRQQGSGLGHQLRQWRYSFSSLFSVFSRSRRSALPRGCDPTGREDLGNEGQGLRPAPPLVPFPAIAIASVDLELV